MNNNNQNFNKKTPNANEEFGTETDVQQIRQQIQQAEANKIQASGAMHSMNEEFANELDIHQIKQQIQQAEANKQQASGRFANKNSTK
ncbi:gamma-type small acid-soluble spore protein [Lysinibacillus xylanilyticus]|uniref:gamma-type small acid-soluble spore protein n=1 Tax=Lysinibacillus xylanilyticus TaxID=582475 RepID=UPI002B25391E|nr:gamma-type small acid-soluble spore protein [Lysinibacillus xylanilyticus]MEB2302716.1 gamma-type small acid-soluble spore protein [Lysinibacillus xylanilyticus]